MKKILIALVAIFSIAFIKHSEASTGLMMIKETASYFTINKIIKILEIPSCGVKGCEYPGKHDDKHENQKFPRPFLWDGDAERYREASKDETAAINGNGKTEVDFPITDDEEDVVDSEEEYFDDEVFEEDEETKDEEIEETIDEEEEVFEEEEEPTEQDEMDDFFKDEYGEDEEEETPTPEKDKTDKPKTKAKTKSKTAPKEDERSKGAEAENDEDDYFDEEEKVEVPTQDEDLDDLDISDWGIKLKEKLDKEIEKVEKEVDKEIEKIQKKRERRSKRNTPTKNKDL